MNFWTWITGLFAGDLPARKSAEANRAALLKAIAAANSELNGFYLQLEAVVDAFAHEHIFFGDRYFRLRFAMKAVVPPADFKLMCQKLKADAVLYTPRAKALELGLAADGFYDFLRHHNHDVIINFLMYDNSVRKLLNTIEEVHLRQLATLAAGAGQPGGSPLGINALIEAFDAEVRRYVAAKAGFAELQAGLASLKLDRPI
jgi:hypothetical protein